jgi:hypothetical protein
MDTYAIMDAAFKGVIFLLFVYCLGLIVRALRSLWRRITGVSIDNVASTTGVVAGKVDGAARRFAAGFRQGFKKAQD